MNVLVIMTDKCHRFLQYFIWNQLWIVVLNYEQNDDIHSRDRLKIPEKSFRILPLPFLRELSLSNTEYNILNINAVYSDQHMDAANLMLCEKDVNLMKISKQEGSLTAWGLFPNHPPTYSLLSLRGKGGGGSFRLELKLKLVFPTACKKMVQLDHRIKTSRPKWCFYHKAEILPVGQKLVGPTDVRPKVFI